MAGNAFSAGAICTAAGSGPIDDSVAIPPGVSITWRIHAPVSVSTAAETLDLSFGPDGLETMSHSSTIVLFRSDSDSE